MTRRAVCAVALSVVVAGLVPSQAGALAGDDGMLAVNCLGICVVDPSTGLSQRVINNGSNPSWSPDGKQIAYLRDYQIWTANADGTNQIQLTHATRYVPGPPSWSPDGRIAYAGVPTMPPLTERIFIIDADGGHLHALSPSTFTYAASLAWLDDGLLVFSGGNPDPQSGALGFFEVRSDGSGLHEVGGRVYGLSQGGTFAFNPRGTRVAISDYHVDYPRVWVDFATFADGAITPGVTSWVMAQDPAWSPSGKTLAVSEEDGVHLYDPNEPPRGANDQLIPNTLQPSWQPRCTITVEASRRTILGTRHRDLICVQGNHDIIRALGGNDVIFVHGSHDTIYAGRGNDVVRTEGGADILNGNRGADLLNARDSNHELSPDVVNGGKGTNVCVVNHRDTRRNCNA